MSKEKEYRVVMHKFIGYSETGSATYEITFNKSLEHTGRFSGIEDGLNDYCKKERRTDIIDNAVREIGKENLEAVRIFANTLKDTPASNVTTNRPFIDPALLGERTEPTPYAKIQRRADFLNNFKDGWDLFNSNALFRSITMLVMDGASVYDMMLELIFMINGQCTPETSHLTSQPNVGTLGADAPNKKI